LAVIPANEELNFRALADQTGDHKVAMLALKEVQAATGYIRGGVTALACKKDYPVSIDELLEICDVISVSAGIRGATDLTGSRRIHPSRQSSHRSDCEGEVSCYELLVVFPARAGIA
jgi:Cys-tRNA(Pro) deacylase